MKSGNLPDASEIGSPKPRGAIQAGETDMIKTKGLGGLPSKYTIMPFARGKKMEVNNDMIGDTVKNPKGQDLGKLEQLIWMLRPRGLSMP